MKHINKQKEDCWKRVRTGVNPAMSMVYVGCCLSHSPSSLLDTAASSSSRLPEARDLALGLCPDTGRALWARAAS